MRCDLHVHTKHSGDVNLPVLRHVGRECYTEPEEVLELALQRGMDLVTITDHDTIDGALRIAGRPEVFVSEEVTCELPGGRCLHLGVFDIDEAGHARIAALRQDAEALFAYLAESRTPFCVNHLFSPLTGKRRLDDFHLALERAPLIEALNGMMPARSNEFARRAGRAHGLAPVGGSDAHARGSIARAYTTVPRAVTKQDFLDGLRQGLTVPVGRSGSYARLTADVATIFRGGYAENAGQALRSSRDLLRFTALMLSVPVLFLLPVVTLISYFKEWARSAELFREFSSSDPPAWRDRRARAGAPLVLGGEL
jgi:predicted metal-dependent phosphoesterase TrpH